MRCLAKAAGFLPQVAVYTVSRVPLLPFYCLGLLLHYGCFVLSCSWRLLKIVLRAGGERVRSCASSKGGKDGNGGKDGSGGKEEKEEKDGEDRMGPIDRLTFLTKCWVERRLPPSVEALVAASEAVYFLFGEHKEDCRSRELLSLLFRPPLTLLHSAWAVCGVFGREVGVVERGTIVNKILEEAERRRRRRGTAAGEEEEVDGERKEEEELLLTEPEEVVEDFEFAKAYHRYALNIYDASRHTNVSRICKKMGIEAQDLLDTNMVQLAPLIVYLVENALVISWTFAADLTSTFLMRKERSLLRSYKRLSRSVCQMWTLARNTEWDVLLAEFLTGTSNRLCPAFVTFVDRKAGSVVLAIKGTSSMADVLTDGSGFSDSFVDGTRAHRGIMQAAEMVARSTCDSIADALQQNEGYRLVVTGHSLGAGTAVLATLLIDQELNDDDDQRRFSVTCVALAPPPVLTAFPRLEPGRDLALSIGCCDDARRPLILCYVNNKDVVPMASVANLSRFKAQLIEVENFVVESEEEGGGGSEAVIDGGEGGGLLSSGGGLLSSADFWTDPGEDARRKAERARRVCEEVVGKDEGENVRLVDGLEKVLVGMGIEEEEGRVDELLGCVVGCVEKLRREGAADRRVHGTVR